MAAVDGGAVDDAAADADDEADADVGAGVAGVDVVVDAAAAVVDDAVA